MKEALQKNHRVIFYGLWLFLGIMQSGLTELQDDEAYYWVYSHFLDWGYFDHPPMTALLIKMGYAIFHNELGVRLFPLLLNLCSLFIIEKLIDKKNPFLFYGIMLSIVAIQIGGFIAVPDNPVMFFTALYFLCYRRFLANTSLLNSFLLGLAVAFLFYSKYHALLIVVFTLFSNWKLLGNYKTWLAGLIALALFAPHLWWQYQHDWVSFKYHLFESNVSAYKVSFTADYIIGQILLAGPIAGIILFPAAVLYKPKSELERALRFTLIGIYVFFLFVSFRGHVEGNWTSPAMAPFVILAHQYLNDRVKWQKLLFKLLPITIILVMITRIVMIADIVPIKEIQKRYHSWKEWPQEMRDKTGGLPIVFRNSYQRASKYWFYSGQETYSVNLYKERKNNFNVWPLEDSLLGKPVYILDNHDVYLFDDSLKTPIGWVGYKYDSVFASFAKINIDAGHKEFTIHKGDSLPLTCSFNVQENYIRFIEKNPSLQDTVRIGVFNTKGWMKDYLLPVTLEEMAQKKIKQVTIYPNLPSGKYYLLFAINRSFRIPTHNSSRIELVIE
jgi:Dolichyl-phosphate-mannose-protein mannosyltransferase